MDCQGFGEKILPLFRVEIFLNKPAGPDLDYPKRGAVCYPTILAALFFHFFYSLFFNGNEASICFRVLLKYDLGNAAHGGFIFFAMNFLMIIPEFP